MNRLSTALLGALVLATIGPLPVLAQPGCTSITRVATVLGSVTVTAGSFTGVSARDTVTGPGVAAGTTVTGVTALTATLSTAAAATGVVTLTFCPPSSPPPVGAPEFGLSAVAAASLVAVVLMKRRTPSIG